MSKDLILNLVQNQFFYVLYKIKKQYNNIMRKKVHYHGNQYKYLKSKLILYVGGYLWL